MNFQHGFSEFMEFGKCGRLNEQTELIAAVQLIGDDFLLCTFLSIQMINSLYESIAAGYKGRESREQ